MVHSKYYKELKQYLEDYHPNLVKDEEFITTRSELAQETFIECSREGMNIEECQNEVNEVLYSGLHFSLYQLVEVRESGIRKVLDEKNVGAVADNIVIFFRAKAESRNSFISTTPLYLCRTKIKAL